MLFLVWFFSLLFLGLGTALSLLRLNKRLPIYDNLPPITILKPLKGIDSGLLDNLESFFHLDYPDYEMIFSVADNDDPAIRVVEQLCRRYPNKKTKLIIGAESIGLNPKINNMLRSYDEAVNDLILISDSNIRAKTDYLKVMVSEMKSDTGVITAVVTGIAPIGIGAQLEASYLNSFYARGMNLAFAFGKPCVVGKSMMFRRSIANRFGGMLALSNYLAEDYVIGENFRKLDLKIKMMKDPVYQYIGEYSFKSFWERHIRWGRIRKAHAILAFCLEPLFMPVVSGIGGAVALQRHFGISFIAVLAAHLSNWVLCDFLLSKKLTNQISSNFLLFWLFRELLAIPLWLVVASGNTVNWRGNEFRLYLGGKMEKLEWQNKNHFFGDQLQALTRWKAIISTAIGGNGRRKEISQAVSLRAQLQIIGTVAEKI